MEALSSFKGLSYVKLGIGLISVYLVQVVCSLVYRAFIYPHYASPLRGIPGPKDHHFLAGQMINQFKSGSPNEPYVSWMKKWPEAPFIRYFSAGNHEALLVTSLGAHKEILQDKAYSFHKSPAWVRLVVNVLGYGIALAEGDEHKRQRRVLNGMFSMSNLKPLIPMFRNKARELCGNFDGAIDSNDGVVQLGVAYSKMMLDIMGAFGLGVELKNLTLDNTTSFQECYHEMFEPDLTGQILMVVDGFVPIRWLPLAANRRYMRASRQVHDQLRNIIRQRIRAVQDAREGGGAKLSDTQDIKDLLTFMVEEMYFAEGTYKWSEQTILDQLLTFMAGGHETTASGLVWATHALTQYPSVATRLREEIDSLLQRSPNPDYSDMESLPYLHNFIREVLRWRTPAVHVHRVAVEDVVVQGVTIPKGTSVVMFPAVVQFNPTIWGDDCEEFDPDRWSRLEGQAANPAAYPAFSLGPRVCIARVMAMMEFKVIMIELVRRFDFEALSSNKVELMNPGPLLRPKGDLKVRVKRRK